MSKFKVTLSSWDYFEALIKDHFWFDTFEEAFAFTRHQPRKDIKIYDELDQLMHHENIKGEVQIASYA